MPNGQIRQINRRSDDMDRLSQVIYKNFIDLKNENVDHNIVSIKRVLNSDHSHSYAYEMNGKIIGYIIAEQIVVSDGRMCMYIYYLYTAKNQRKQGVSTQLLKKLIMTTKNLGVSCILLLCRKSNLSAISLYKSVGFNYDTMKHSDPKFKVLSLRLP